MRKTNKLTDLKIKSIKSKGLHGDGNGLWLQVSTTGTKSWTFRYTLSRKPRQMGLGSVNTLSLKEAREKARGLRQHLLDGVDPIQAREKTRISARLDLARGVTFRECADRYIEAHSVTWKNSKHRVQWKSTLDTYANPVIGDLPVANADLALLLKILEPIWMTKPETASRVRGRIERILDWATVREYRHGENPARWKGHLDKVLPAHRKVKNVRHHPAMPYADLPLFMEQIRANDAISARALEFTVLTAARTGEAIGAKWDEFDFKTKIWTVPGERTKTGRQHRVPLSARTIEILEALPRLEDYIFPGAKSGRPLSNMAMLQLLRGMNDEGFTVHGFRSTFRDWAGEQTNHPREIAEAALAHVIADKVEAAYLRGDALEKRRRLMRDWANYCNSPRTEDTSDNVVAIRGGD